MPKLPPPSSDRALARGSVPGADAELTELMAMLGEEAAEDDATGIDDADLATLLEGLGASAKEREEAEVRQLLEGLPELSSDAELGARNRSDSTTFGGLEGLKEAISGIPPIRAAGADDSDELPDSANLPDVDDIPEAGALTAEAFSGEDVAIETLEAPVDEYMDGADEDADAESESSPLLRNAAAGVQVPSVMRRRAESDFISGDYVSSEYKSDEYGEHYGAEKLHDSGIPLEDSEGTEPALPEGIPVLPVSVEPVNSRMTLRDLLPLDVARVPLEALAVTTESLADSGAFAQAAPTLSIPSSEPIRAGTAVLERSPRRAQAFPTDPEHTLPPLRDPLASRKAIAEERIQQLLTEDIQSLQAFRMLRFFVVTGVDRVTLDELQEELVEPRETLQGILSHLMASGLVIAEGTTFALNTRARKLSLLGTAVAWWQTPRRREQLLSWLKK